MRARSARGWLYAALFCSLAGCSARSSADPSRPAAPPVHVDAVRSELYAPTASATATLEPDRRAVLTPRTPGIVSEVMVAVGDVVGEGEPLLRVDAADSATAARLAEADLARAELELAEARRESTRATRLGELGATPARATDQAEAAAEAATIAVRAARAQVGAARRGVTQTILRAPFAGSIAEWQVEVGELVRPGVPVGVLIDASPLTAMLLMNPRDVLELLPGAPVRVEAFARRGTSFEGSVTRLGTSVDAATRRLPVFIRLDADVDWLRPGLLVRCDVQVSSQRQVHTVAPSAVFERSGRRFVYVVSSGRAERREVELGDTVGARQEVRSGLVTGEVVVTAGRARVVDGGEVEVTTSREGAR